jgi:threonine aldolase
MRQAGILAAAGIYALDHNIERLAEDHANARMLAEMLAGHPLVRLNPAHVETNIIFVEMDERVSSGQLTDLAREKGVLFLPRGPHSIRIVTHLDVSSADVTKAGEIILKILDGMKAA